MLDTTLTFPGYDPGTGGSVSMSSSGFEQVSRPLGFDQPDDGETFYAA